MAAEAGGAKRACSGEEGDYGSPLRSRSGTSGAAGGAAADSRKKARPDADAAGLALHPAAELDAVQAELVAKFVQSIDPHKESIVISNPRAKGACVHRARAPSCPQSAPARAGLAEQGERLAAQPVGEGMRRLRLGWLRSAPAFSARARPSGGGGRGS
jgi:hypothetical protein